MDIIDILMDTVTVPGPAKTFPPAVASAARPLMVLMLTGVVVEVASQVPLPLLRTTVRVETLPVGALPGVVVWTVDEGQRSDKPWRSDDGSVVLALRHPYPPNHPRAPPYDKPGHSQNPTRGRTSGIGGGSEWRRYEWKQRRGGDRPPDADS